MEMYLFEDDEPTNVGSSSNVPWKWAHKIGCHFLRFNFGRLKMHDYSTFSPLILNGRTSNLFHNNGKVLWARHAHTASVLAAHEKCDMKPTKKKPITFASFPLSNTNLMSRKLNKSKRFGFFFPRRYFGCAVVASTSIVIVRRMRKKKKKNSRMSVYCVVWHLRNSLGSMCVCVCV